MGRLGLRVERPFWRVYECPRCGWRWVLRPSEREAEQSCINDCEGQGVLLLSKLVKKAA